MMKRVFALATLLTGALWAQPVIVPGSTVNAADYSRNIAPGSYVTIFGTNLAPSFESATSVPLPKTLAGTSVEVTDGIKTEQLSLWYVSPGQLAGQIGYDLGTAVKVRVVTAAGNSDWDVFTLVPHAPALYAVNQQGEGRAVVVHQDTNGNPSDDLVTRKNPIKPGQWVTLYANGLGAVAPTIPAGEAAGDGSTSNPWNKVSDPVSVTIYGADSNINFAGLTPYLAGLYQVNVFTPYYDVIGDVDIRLAVAGIGSQANISVPVEPNGFYLVVGASKFPNGQTMNAVPGPGSAIVFRHETPSVWGQGGYKQWVSNWHTGALPEQAATSGLALTLMNQGQVVYDNNGIEDDTFGKFYNNSDGAVPDNQKPGLWEWYSMSNNLYAMFAGHFKLSAPTTFDQIIGYFDGNGNIDLPFDPNNVYNTFRMNIFSNGSGNMPAVNSFTGDVFTSDTTPGTFAFTPTDAERVFSDGVHGDRIYRLVYTLKTPITLPAGDYWFSHDVAVPAKAGGGTAPASFRIRATSRAHKPLPPANAFVSK